jgi:hypothetical protein
MLFLFKICLALMVGFLDFFLMDYIKGNKKISSGAKLRNLYLCVGIYVIVCFTLLFS